MKKVSAINPASYGDLERVSRAIKKEGLERPDKQFNIYICEKSERRTLPQNRYLYGVVFKSLSDSTGYTKEAIHEFCIDEFAPLHFVEAFGKIMEKKKRTSEMDTKEMTEFIDSIRLFSVEQGHGEIPLPNELPMDVYVEVMNG